MDPTVELLRELAPAVPREMTVIVLCDRGISSPKLWKQIRAQGWHPCMRYRNNITFCADGGKRLPARRFVSVPDTAWIGRAPPSAPPRPTPLHPAGGLVRPAGGTLDHPHRPAAGSSGSELVRSPLLDRTGLQGHQEHGLEVGQDQKDRTPPASPATGWCFRWRRSWPWPTAPGRKTPMTAGSPQATCGRRPSRLLPSIATVGRSRNGRSAYSGAASIGCAV